MFKPLEGVKVIDLTYFVAGPGAARILADWGADVIKVEPSFGDPGRGTGATMSCPTNKDCNPFYTAYNANKRGLSLNLKSEDGKAILDKMLETADVFVSSYRTGALKRLGLDYDSLSKKFPHLIWAQINGFGDFGSGIGCRGGHDGGVLHGAGVFQALLHRGDGGEIGRASCRERV